MSPFVRSIPSESNLHPASEVPCFRFQGLSSYDDLSHAVYTRHGGVSEPPFHSLNTSHSSGDVVERVRANLQIIRKTMAATSLRGMKQVHGTNIALIHPNDPTPLGELTEADAMVTAAPGIALMVKQADCQAIILFDPLKKVISNVHCGWRGNISDLLSRVVHRMRDAFGCSPSDLRAAIGPSLGPCCAEFVTHRELFPQAFQAFMVRENHFDLWALSRWQLLEAGLKRENIEVAGICTKCRTDLFYSYRAEGVTGRSATVVMLKGSS